MNRFYTLIAGLVLILASPLGIAKEAIGWVENVRIYPGGIVLKAKIDTGAKTSSLHAEHIIIVERNRQRWVDFVITNNKGESIKLEKKIERISKIKRHYDDKQERVVIQLGICLGKIYKETEVNLIDRRGMNYQILIGRRFLKGSHIIDPALTFTRKPRCTMAW